MTFNIKSKGITDWLKRVSCNAMHSVDCVNPSLSNLMQLTIDSDALPGTDSSHSGYQDCYKDQLHSSQSDELPHVFYWTLFPPRIPQHRLASDGYDATWTPPAPYSKRMWAGGSIEWLPVNPLRLMQRVSQTSRLEAVNQKTDDSVFVTMKHNIENESGLSVSENRTYVYLRETANIRRRQIQGNSE